MEYMGYMEYICRMDLEERREVVRREYRELRRDMPNLPERLYDYQVIVVY